MPEGAAEALQCRFNQRGRAGGAETGPRPTAAANGVAFAAAQGVSTEGAQEALRVAESFATEQ